MRKGTNCWGTSKRRSEFMRARLRRGAEGRPAERWPPQGNIHRWRTAGPRIRPPPSPLATRLAGRTPLQKVDHCLGGGLVGNTLISTEQFKSKDPLPNSSQVQIRMDRSIPGARNTSDRVGQTTSRSQVQALTQLPLRDPAIQRSKGRL